MQRDLLVVVVLGYKAGNAGVVGGGGGGELQLRDVAVLKEWKNAARC